MKRRTFLKGIVGAALSPLLGKSSEPEDAVLPEAARLSVENNPYSHALDGANFARILNYQMQEAYNRYLLAQTRILNRFPGRT